MTEPQVLEHIIESRKSTYPKDFTSEKIPDDVLEKILKSAQFAPNHKKTKPWRFKTFRNAEKKLLGEELASIYKKTVSKEQFLEKKYLDILSKIDLSDAVISISVNFSGLVPEWEEIAATAMAVQNIYLSCTANKVGCYWSSLEYTALLKDFLNLEDQQKCYGLFYMGML